MGLHAPVIPVLRERKKFSTSALQVQTSKKSNCEDEQCNCRLQQHKTAQWQLTTLPDAHARWSGVIHLLSFVFTLAPGNHNYKYNVNRWIT